MIEFVEISSKDVFILYEIDKFKLHPGSKNQHAFYFAKIEANLLYLMNKS